MSIYVYRNIYMYICVHVHVFNYMHIPRVNLVPVGWRLSTLLMGMAPCNAASVIIGMLFASDTNVTLTGARTVAGQTLGGMLMP